MWLELAGSGAAWLSHTSWYVGRGKRRALFGPWLDDRTGRLLSGGAWVWLAVSLGCWVAEHGSVLGTCCWLAAVTGAASVNTIVAPLAPRGVLVGAAMATVCSLVGIAMWLHGA